MVQLLEQDIQTKEVLDWKGVHLFHFMSSSCSQKTRITLNLKGIDWESHHINLGEKEHFTPWYLGINPRGLVPTLVVDGDVHIESNDIMQHLDQIFPDVKMIPDGMEEQMAELLHHEDELHLDLRTITFRFTQPRGKSPRTEEDLENYRKNGTGTVGGKPDTHKDVEIAFWETAADDGITDAAIKTSAERFRAALDDLDRKLNSQNYLIGDSLSILDVAWVIYINRLVRCGYPLDRLHPNVDAWFWPLRDMPEIANEIGVPPEVQKAIEAHHQTLRENGKTLVDVAGL